MQRFGKVLGKVLAFVILTIVAIWLLVPLDGVDRKINFESNAIGPDVDAYLAAEELQFSDITPGVQKRVIWAGAVGARTPLAVVYIHGFSATSEEIRPVPDRVAAALGANLFFTRLTGHGRTGQAMAEANVGDWINDMAEAMAIGRAIGERVVVISTSTGATLAAIAATDPVLSADMAGVVMISPNFRIRSAAARILDLPLARYWGPWVAGKTRSFATTNADHMKYWTTSYPTQALFPMAALIREAAAQDYARAKVPAMFIYSDADQVIDPNAVAPVRDAWGGAVSEDKRVMGPEDDPYSHVIAGDIQSPGQTSAVADEIIAWAKGL